MKREKIILKVINLYKRRESKMHRSFRLIPIVSENDYLKAKLLKLEINQIDYELENLLWDNFKIILSDVIDGKVKLENLK